MPINWLSVIGFPIAASLHLAAQEPVSLSPADIAARAEPATVTIVAIGPGGDTLGMGSGFLLRADGAVVTSWHVVAGAALANVVLSTGATFTAVNALAADSARDIAILKVPGSGLPILLPAEGLPPIGTRVVVLGSPRGLASTVSDGLLSARRGTGADEQLQITAPISPGSSGGPVLDLQGRVIGIVRATLPESQQVNFAVPIQYAVALLSGGHEQPLAAVIGSSSASPGHLPVRTASPRPAVTGTFRYTVRRRQRATTAADSGVVAQAGLLLLLPSGNGLVTTRFPTSLEPQSERVYTPLSLVTTDRGQVTIGLIGGTYDGYQTDTGFFAERLASTDSMWVEWLTASSFELPLSQATGLYTATQQGTITAGKGRARVGVPESTWIGQMAAVIQRDSLFLVVFLRSAAGGTSGGYFSGPIGPDGRFILVRPKQEVAIGRLRERNTTIRGTLEGGRIWADITAEMQVAGSKELATYDAVLQGTRE